MKRFNLMKRFNPMKRSLTVRYTMILTGVIVFSILLLWILNKAFLVDFYQYSKNKALASAYMELSDILEDVKEGMLLTEEQALAMEKIEFTKNVDIDVIFIKYQGRGISSYVVYPTHLSEEQKGTITDKMNAYFASNILSKKILIDKENYSIYKFMDSRTGLVYIDLLGKVADNYLILLRTNYESIQENVGIANTFLGYIGAFTTIIGAVIILIITRRITEPILQLNGIARRMCNLEFDAKYTGNIGDEIDQLGSSINLLSEKLETTISELKTANNELKKDIETKTQIDDMRKEFLSNVSHELKTPIALIQGYAEGLQENINEDQESKDFYCEVITDEANKMNKMVKKLLSLNQIEFGTNQVEFERFDIVALIHSVLSATDILMKQKDVILYFDAQEPVYVWADEYMVEEVLTNYISNALNHVDGNRIVEVKLVKKRDVVRIAVYNTGANIPEEELEKVWVKFYKVDKARTRAYGGSGIGLSIVKAIMQSLHRECGVVNHEKGVEFWFELDIENE